MDLSNELISQFAKITKDQNKTSTESIVYGTAVTQGGKLYVNIDGSDSITPVVTSSEIKAGERVTVMIKDHTATIMGNISNPSASTETVGKVLDEYDIIVAKIGNFELLVADKVSTKELEAKLAIIDEALIGKATIAELEAVKATIKDLDVSNLYAEIARIDEAIITKADIVDLDAVHAAIDFVEADIAEIETLIGGHLTMDNIQSLVLTASKVTVDNAFIKDAMIDRVSASKLDAGTINTSLVNIASGDGSMTITGSLQQFKDADGNVRIQIGKDASGDFTFVLYGADGQGQLINQNGITASAIGDGLIVNDMVADNAAIAGNKLDIDSVITEINGSTTTIKSSKIFFDESGQSLEVAFSELETKIEDIGSSGVDEGTLEQIRTNTTSINTMQGKINTLISNTTITKENGDVVQLKDEFSTLNQTVSSFEGKISLLETTQEEVTSKMTEFEIALGEINVTVNENIVYMDENGNTVYVKDRVTENSTKLDSVSTTVSSMESHFDEDGTVTNLTKQVSSLEQFASQFSMEFFQKIENADQGVNELLSYIHFDADGITIGQDHYPIRLMLTKDRIKFIDQNETQVAYFSEGKLYVNNAEILDTFKIGNYGFMSTANGSLTIGALS